MLGESLGTPIGNGSQNGSKRITKLLNLTGAMPKRNCFETKSNSKE